MEYGLNLAANIDISVYFEEIEKFNGIGGFQLAADWCGWDNVAHCEIDDFCNKVVARHFPHSKCYKDIKKFTGSEYRGIIAGCTPNL